MYQFNQLRFQFDWRGAALENIRVLVCDRCRDTPQEQLRSIVVPADPTPIIQARPQDYVAASSDYDTISAPTVYDPVTGIPIPPTTTILAQDGQQMTPQPVGLPVDIDINAVMPLQGTNHYAVQLAPLSVTANGTDQITVTFSAAHGLVTGNQIVVQGLTDTGACGAFSVVVTTGTAFTYQTNRNVAAGALLTATTRMITANVGLPYNYGQVPLTGV